MLKNNDQLPSLESLQVRIDKAKSLADEGNDDTISTQKTTGAAMELATGLFAGCAIGGAAGYFIDRWLGSSPIGLIIGFFLGFAVGLMNLIKKVKKD